MTIGIIGAMETEVTYLRSKMNTVTVNEICSMEYRLGTIDGCAHNIVLVKAGMGKVSAAVCTQVLIDRFGVDCVINIGVAGSLVPELKVGCVAISEDTVYHDVDSSAIGDEPGFVSGIDMKYFPCDEKLISVALNACANLGLYAIKGRIASGDQFIANNSVKERIVSLFNAVCCEMEGAAIAHTCYLNKVPVVIVRTISDGADDASDNTYADNRDNMANVGGKIAELMLKEI